MSEPTAILTALREQDNRVVAELVYTDNTTWKVADALIFDARTATEVGFKAEVKSRLARAAAAQVDLGETITPFIKTLQTGPLDLTVAPPDPPTPEQIAQAAFLAKWAQLLAAGPRLALAVELQLAKGDELDALRADVVAIFLPAYVPFLLGIPGKS